MNFPRHHPTPVNSRHQSAAHNIFPSLRTLGVLLVLGFISATAAYSAPLATVNVVSPGTTIAANSVVTFGQVFSVGEVSTAQSLVATSASATPLPTQMNVKRRHPDGSVRHAIISVRLPAAVTLNDVNATGSPIDYRVEIVEYDQQRRSAHGARKPECRDHNHYGRIAKHRPGLLTSCCFLRRQDFLPGDSRMGEYPPASSAFSPVKTSCNWDSNRFRVWANALQRINPWH